MIYEEVEEPQYSLSRLEKFEQKYQISTEEFIKNPEQINDKGDKMAWLHNYIIYGMIQDI